MVSSNNWPTTGHARKEPFTIPAAWRCPTKLAAVRSAVPSVILRDNHGRIALKVVCPRLGVPRATKALQRNQEVTKQVVFNMNRVLTVAFVVIGAVIGIQILAALAPTFFTAVADLNQEFNTADVNDTTANSILPIFPTLLGLAGVVAIVVLALAAFKLRGT